MNLVELRDILLPSLSMTSKKYPDVDSSILVDFKENRLVIITYNMKNRKTAKDYLTMKDVEDKKLPTIWAPLVTKLCSRK